MHNMLHSGFFYCFIVLKFNNIFVRICQSERGNHRSLIDVLIDLPQKKKVFNSRSLYYSRHLKKWK